MDFLRWQSKKKATKPTNQKNPNKQKKAQTQKTNCLAEMKNKPSIQKSKRDFFSPDGQSWWLYWLSSALKCCCRAELDVVLFCSAQCGSLRQGMRLPCKTPPWQKSLTAIYGPVVELFPDRSECYHCPHLTTSSQSSASATQLLYLLLEPKTLTSRQEGGRSCVGCGVFNAIYLKNVCYWKV